MIIRGVVSIYLDPRTVSSEANEKDGKQGAFISVVDYSLSRFDSVLQDREKF